VWIIAASAAEATGFSSLEGQRHKKSTPPLRRMLTKEFMFQYHSKQISESFLCSVRFVGISAYAYQYRYDSNIMKTRKPIAIKATLPFSPRWN